MSSVDDVVYCIAAAKAGLPLSTQPLDVAKPCAAASLYIAKENPLLIIPSKVLPKEVPPIAASTCPVCWHFSTIRSSCSSPTPPSSTYRYLLCLASLLSFASSPVHHFLFRRPLLYTFLSSGFSSLLSQLLFRLRTQAQWPALLAAAWKIRNTPQVRPDVTRARTHTSFCSWRGDHPTTRAEFPQESPVTDAEESTWMVALGCRLLLYSSLSLVLTDIAVGCSLCIVLWRYTSELIHVLHMAYNFLNVDVLKAQVDWLMRFPAGMKLNHNLTMFLGSIIVTTIELWNEVTLAASNIEPLLVRVLGVISVLGVSVQLAALSDILNLCTLHVFYVYVVVARVLALSLRTMYSLLLLFRGSKWNVLRLRVDSLEVASPDELLLGAIFFTVLFFLLPTILVFYITFALIWLIIVATQSVLLFFRCFFNHFPLYLVFLHFVDPQMIPGGVTMRLLGSERTGLIPCAYHGPRRRGRQGSHPVVTDQPSRTQGEEDMNDLYPRRHAYSDCEEIECTRKSEAQTGRNEGAGGPLPVGAAECSGGVEPEVLLRPFIHLDAPRCAQSMRVSCCQRPKTKVFLLYECRPLPLPEKLRPFLLGLEQSFVNIAPKTVLRCLALGRVLHLQRPRLPFSSPHSILWTCLKRAFCKGSSTEDRRQSPTAWIDDLCDIPRFPHYSTRELATLVTAVLCEGRRWIVVAP